LRGDAAIDDEAGAGHEVGIVRGEKDDALAMSVAVPMRPIGMRFSVCWRAGSWSFVLILRARIARTPIAHIGVDRPRVALAREFERCRLGEQSDPARGIE
jgi:hypothetical protein